MIMKSAAFAVLMLAFTALTRPAAGQSPGLNTPLTDDDRRILELVGESFGNALKGVGKAYRFLLLDEAGDKNLFYSHMKTADGQLVELKKLLLLTRPNNRDLIQMLEPVIAAKASMETGAKNMLTTLNTTAKKNLPQDVAKLGNRVDHFAYSFSQFEQKLRTTLIFMYGTENRFLAAAEAAAYMQWDTMEAIAATTGYLLAGESFGQALVTFETKLADFDTQVTKFRRAIDLTQPNKKPVTAALDTLVQKKEHFEATARPLVKSMGPKKSISSAQLNQLSADMDAFSAAMLSFIDKL